MDVTPQEEKPTSLWRPVLFKPLVIRGVSEMADYRNTIMLIQM
jgi:hypothetical protein